MLIKNFRSLGFWFLGFWFLGFRFLGFWNFGILKLEILKRMGLWYLGILIFWDHDTNPDPLYGGHIGIKRMLSKVKSKYLWKNMTKDITNYIKNFKKCQINKSGKKTKEKLTITPIAQTAFDIVAIDTRRE